MDLLNYASDGSEGDDKAQSLGSDDDSASSEQSLDSAEIRARTAEARLKDFGEGAPAPAASLLPSAADVFDEVSGLPSFLDPEATRPLAAPARHGAAAVAAAAAEAAAAAAAQKAAGGRSGRQVIGPGFDISRLAPKIKGDPNDKRSGPVIEGKAKRYKTEDGPAAGQYTALQIALMGGSLPEQQQPDGGSGGGGGGGGGRAAGVGPQREPAAENGGARTKPTGAMAVSDFLDRGHGAAQLPRKTQDRKEKEREKRARGQSTHSHWKSEAEMALRQQFD